MIMWIVRFYVFAVKRVKYGPLIAFGVMLTGLFGNSLAFMYFDDQSFGDSVWYSYISITTIGYGDFYATTVGSRLANFFFIGLIGLSSCSYLIGWTIDKIATTVLNRRQGMSVSIARNHILIVNFPSELRVKQIINEVRSDKLHENIEFVIVTDSIDQLPFDIPGVEFVKGSPIEEETFVQARCCDAIAAFVLATDYNDPSSDALTSTSVGVIEGMCPEVRTVAECLQRKHKSFFDKLNCDSVVCANEIGTNLMVQELQDHGVTEVFNVLTSNIKTQGDTLFSATISECPDGCSYNKLAHSFVDGSGNLVSVKRFAENALHTDFPKGLHMKEGDTVVFTAKDRYSAQELIHMAQTYNADNSGVYI